MKVFSRPVSTWNLIFLGTLTVLFLFVVYPMFAVSRTSLLDADTGVFTLKNYTVISTVPFYCQLLGWSPSSFSWESCYRHGARSV
ncbi:MAG: hypothetical protein LBS77_05120 [Desulfovibrio sp.]|jgi:hypothetical protein|nr:hypothetical protein [Desulfovibrio sp.]